MSEIYLKIVQTGEGRCLHQGAGRYFSSGKLSVVHQLSLFCIFFSLGILKILLVIKN